MILNAACQTFNKAASWQMADHLSDPTEINITKSNSTLDYWQQLFHKHHNIWQDNLALKNTSELNDAEFARHFDSLRRVYPDRFEYDRYRLLTSIDKKTAAKVRRLFPIE
jgi:hypothetical protein